MSITSAAYIAKSTLTLIVILNEIFPICNHWVISPTTSTASATSSSLLTNFEDRTLTTTVAYAVGKPIITALLLRLPVPPWIIVMALPAQSLLTNDITSQLAWTIDREDATAAARNHEKEQPNEPYQRSRTHRLISIFCFLSPVVIAATCDSALALTAKSMILAENRRNHIVGLIAFATLLYVLCASFTNYILCRRLRRGAKAYPACS